MSRFPVRDFGGNRDASETVVFDGDASFLMNAVFKAGAEPWVRVAGNVYCGGGDEVIP